MPNDGLHIPNKLRDRPRRGGLVVPYMVSMPEEPDAPVDFKMLDHEALKQCAAARRCGICGRKIKPKDTLAFIGPERGERDHNCFSDPWMHEVCALYAIRECPYVSGRNHTHRGSMPPEGSVEAEVIHNLDEDPTYLWMVERASVEPMWTAQRMALAIAQGVPIPEDPSPYWHYMARGRVKRRQIIDGR